MNYGDAKEKVDVPDIPEIIRTNIRCAGFLRTGQFRTPPHRQKGLNMSAFVTREQRAAACKADLYTWLLRHHPSEVIQKYGSVLLRSNPHVSVKEGFHGYLDFRAGESGNTIDYLKNFLGYTYPEAVLALIPDSGPSPVESRDFIDTGSLKTAPSQDTETVVTPETVLSPESPPKPAAGTRNVFAFLTKQRGFPAEVVRMLIEKGLLYQSETGNNAVFINPERDYWEIRGTNTIADRRCRHRSSCQNYVSGEHCWCLKAASCDRYRPDPFHGSSKNQGTRFWYLKPSDARTETIYICESAIDAVSLCIIHASRHKAESAVYISIGGAGKQQVIDRIKRHHPHTVIATDNDPAGDDCRKRNQELPSIRPRNKDWNEDLLKGDIYAGH